MFPGPTTPGSMKRLEGEKYVKEEENDTRPVEPKERQGVSVVHGRSP